MFETLGTAKIKWNSVMTDMPAIIERNTHDEKTNDGLWNIIYRLWGKDQRTDEFKLAKAAYDHIYDRRGRNPAEKVREYLQELRSYVEAFDATFKCLYSCEDFCILSLGGEAYTIMLPPQYVELSLYRDYASLTAAQRYLILAGGNESGTYNPQDKTLAEDPATSYEGAMSALDQKKEAAAALRQRMEDVKEARTGELNALRLEIEAKQRELEEKQHTLMAELEARKAEMELQLEKMEMDIYRLSSEIYAIRCYTGECVDFLRIRQGRTAMEDTPLVLHQKMRYMDEELGKLASIYNVDFRDKGRFEDLIRYNDHALDAFAPTDRSLMLVRVSRTNKGYYNHADYENMVDVSKKYRGTCIAIVLRDGENVYVGWTDESKIDFSEEMFLRPGTYEDVDPDAEQRKYESDSDYEKRMKAKAKKSLSESVGRMFIFSILQGAIDRGMVKFPVPVNVNKPSEYIVRSFADGWLEDNKYGEFTDIIDRCNKVVKAGDHILSTQSLRAEALKDFSGRHAYNQSWHNDRGRGEKNRTHDVFMSDCTIYPINLVERRADYRLTLHYADGSSQTHGYRDTTEAQMKGYGKRQIEATKWRHDSARVVSFEIEPTSDFGEDEIFVSLEKDNWRDATSRANFQVYRSEFINLRCMCSTWLIYTLTNHKTSGIRIGGHEVDFAHLIPYLKTALSFVQKREAEELELLKPVIPSIESDPEWPAKLSEWKLETGKKLYKQTVKSFAEYYYKKRGAVSL